MNKKSAQWHLKEALDAVLLAQSMVPINNKEWDELEIAFSHLKALEEEVNSYEL